MPTVLIETAPLKRVHRETVQQLLAMNPGLIRIASPYISESDLLADICKHQVQLVTSTEPEDIVSGASSYTALETLLKSGVRCKYHGRPPLLHAKVYMFGDKAAIITSANLTSAALDRNIEVGVVVYGEEVAKLLDWFDDLWTQSEQFRLSDLEQVRPQIEARRSWLAEQQNAAPRTPTWGISRSAKVLLSSRRHPLRGRISAKTIPPSLNLLERLQTARACWVCNTHRRSKSFPEPTILEGLMHEHYVAAAWPDPHEYKQMRNVQKDDVILMLGSGAGIVGVGIAELDGCDELKPGDPDAIREIGFRRLEITPVKELPEWRIPIEEWLFWNPRQPLRWKGTPGTFMTANSEKLMQLRQEVAEKLG